MKSLLVFCLWISFSYLSAQVDSMLVLASPTTVDEYNYLTKGYKIQVESGLDMKKGYYFSDIGEHRMENYHFTLKNLVREERNDLAGILVITYSMTSGRTYYTCIPINNPELMRLSAASVAKWDRGMNAAYVHVISAYLAVYFHARHSSQ